MLMNFLDRDGSGTIDMSEFLVGIRVNLFQQPFYNIKGFPQLPKINDDRQGILSF